MILNKIRIHGPLNKIPTYICIKRKISALFISGDKANENYAILTPYFEFHKRLDDSEHKINANLNKRNITNINVTKLYQYWDIYRDIQQKKNNLETKRVEIAEALRKLDETDKKNENIIRKHKIDGVLVREDLKQLKEHSYSLEEKFIHEYLSLPNDLHAIRSNLAETDPVIYNHMELNKSQVMQTQSHLVNTDLVEYYNPYCYYLKGAAAEFDLNLSYVCVDFFKQLGYVQFSNPDFSKTILLEAAGVDTVKTLAIKEETMESSVNLTHLIGGASMLSYLGYFTKLSVFKSSLPLKLVSTGRQYVQPSHLTALGLYSVCQSSQCQLFVATATADEAAEQFDKTLEELKLFLQKFNEHFRFVYVPADELTMAEEFRINVEMYSAHFRQYIPVGNLCSYSDYISKRLLFCYKDGVKKEFKFPHLISGTILNIPKLIAILLENKKTLKLPKC